MGLDTSNVISFRRHVLYQSFPDPPGPGVIVRTQLSGGKKMIYAFSSGKTSTDQTKFPPLASILDHKELVKASMK